MKNINLNARIRAKLTPHGVKVYRAYYQSLFSWYPAHDHPTPKTPPLKRGNVFEGELWHFMTIFGNHMVMGKPNVTVGTDLEVISLD